MSMKNYFYVALFEVFIFCGCIVGGSHGTIKFYDFHVSKINLQKIVDDVIRENHNITRDTARSSNDSSKMDYYNDGVTYISFEIAKGKEKNNYTVRFGGDSLDWDTSSTAELILVYAFDKDGKGGSEENGGLNCFHSRLRNRLLDTFEYEFTNKISIIINKKRY